MVHIEDWETFYAEAEKLYIEHPAHTRYVLKYRHKDGKLVLKVTNDRVCLKFTTDQAQDVKRIEKLNNLFVTHMCGKDPHEATEVDDSAQQKADRPPSSEDAGTAPKKRRGKR